MSCQAVHLSRHRIEKQQPGTISRDINSFFTSALAMLSDQSSSGRYCALVQDPSKSDNDCDC